jgi:hypothetical protein
VESLRIRLVGNEWEKESTLLRTTRRKRGPLVIWTNTSGEISTGMVKLEEAIEKPCSDVLAHTPEVCKHILSNQRVPGCQGFMTHGDCVQSLQSVELS